LLLRVRLLTKVTDVKLVLVLESVVSVSDTVLESVAVVTELELATVELVTVMVDTTVVLLESVNVLTVSVV
jgi:hypothetical protein